MAKKKLQETDILIEQCLQDARIGYIKDQINEGWWDDFMAKERGGWEATKTRAGNLFRRSKNKKHVETARLDGSVKSYAKSLANTMQSFKRYGGSLGNNIKNVDDVINRLKKVANGEAIPQNNTTPQQSASSLQPAPKQQPSQSEQSVQAPQQSNNAVSGQETANQQAAPATASSQNASIVRKPRASSSNNAAISNKGKGVTPLPKYSVPSQSNTPAQKQMLDTLEQTPSNEPMPTNTEMDTEGQQAEVQGAQPERRSAKERLKGMKAARKKRQEAIEQRKATEKAQQVSNPQLDIKPNPIYKTKPGQKPILRKSSNPKTQKITPANTENNTQLSKGQGTNVGDISNITYQQPLTTSMGDTIVGGYDANSYIEPKAKISNQQAQLPSPKEKEQPKLMNNSDNETIQDTPMGLPAPARKTKKLLTKSAPAPKQLKIGKAPAKRRRILTVKNALNNKRQKENMDAWVNQNPDMFMMDSYEPYTNTNGQLQMLNSIK